MTSGEVRISEESAGHLGSTPLPVGAEVLANPDSVILTREWKLEDDLVWTKITFCNPELRTLGGESRMNNEGIREENERWSSFSLLC